jgi:hypothetical protein
LQIRSEHFSVEREGASAIQPQMSTATLLIAFASAFKSFPPVRAFATRNSAWIFEIASSIGLKSG